MTNMSKQRSTLYQLINFTLVSQLFISLEAAFFTTVKCPRNGQTACALNGSVIEFFHGVSLAQCTSVCGKQTTCNWFNYFNANDTNSCGKGFCQLFNTQPQLIGINPSCKLYKASFEYIQQLCHTVYILLFKKR